MIVIIVISDIYIYIYSIYLQYVAHISFNLLRDMLCDDVKVSYASFNGLKR